MNMYTTIYNHWNVVLGDTGWGQLTPKQVANLSMLSLAIWCCPSQIGLHILGLYIVYTYLINIRQDIHAIGRTSYILFPVPYL